MAIRLVIRQSFARLFRPSYSDLLVDLCRVTDSIMNQNRSRMAEGLRACFLNDSGVKFHWRSLRRPFANASLAGTITARVFDQDATRPL